MGQLLLNKINYSGVGAEGSSVQVTPILLDGVEIATITVGQDDYSIYAPNTTVLYGTTAPDPQSGEDGNIYVEYSDTPTTIEAIYIKIEGDWVEAATGGGGGSIVTITPSINTGTKIADYTINNVAGELYSPNHTFYGTTAPSASVGVDGDIYTRYIRGVPQVVSYLKFVITKNRGNGGTTQLSEFKFTDANDSPFDFTGSTVTADTSHPGFNGEGPQNIIDNSLATKYCTGGGVPSAASPITLTITLGSTLDISTYSIWSWYTANDSSDRDPVSFALYGSVDGTTWNLIEEVEDATITTNRQTKAYEGTINFGDVTDKIDKTYVKLNGNWRENSSGGTNVEANPLDTATGTLTKIKIDGTVYEIQGGSGSSGKREIIHQTNRAISDNLQITLNLENKYIDPYVYVVNAIPLSGWGGLVVVKDTESFVYDSTNDTITFQVYTNAGQNYNLDWIVEERDASGGGSAVIANPSGTATDTLNKISIDGTIYDIEGGGGSGGGVILDKIYQSPSDSPESTITLEESFLDYDLLLLSLSHGSFSQIVADLETGDYIGGGDTGSYVWYAVDLSHPTTLTLAYSGSGVWIRNIVGVKFKGGGGGAGGGQDVLYKAENTTVPQSITLDGSITDYDYIITHIKSSVTGRATIGYIYTVEAMAAGDIVGGELAAGSGWIWYTYTNATTLTYLGANNGYYIAEITGVKISSGGTNVEANPIDTPTDTLETIKIGDTVYDIASSGGGSYKCEELYTNEGSSVPSTIELSASILNYDAIVLNGYRSGMTSYFSSDMYLKEELVTGRIISLEDDTYYAWYTITDNTTLTNNTSNIIITKIYGLKFGTGGSGGGASDIVKIYDSGSDTSPAATNTDITYIDNIDISDYDLIMAAYSCDRGSVTYPQTLYGIAYLDEVLNDSVNNWVLAGYASRWVELRINPTYFRVGVGDYGIYKLYAIKLGSGGGGTGSLNAEEMTSAEYALLPTEDKEDETVIHFINDTVGGDVETAVDMADFYNRYEGSMSISVNANDELVYTWNSGVMIGASSYRSIVIPSSITKIKYKITTGTAYSTTTQRFKIAIGVKSTYSTSNWASSDDTDWLAVDIQNTQNTEYEGEVDLSSITSDSYLMIGAHGWNVTFNEITLVEEHEPTGSTKIMYKDVEYGTGGGSSGGGSSLVKLAEYSGSGVGYAAGDVITLSESIMNYDLLMFTSIYYSGTEGFSNAIVAVDDFKNKYTTRLYHEYDPAAYGDVVYTSDTTITVLRVGNAYTYSVYGIKFGSGGGSSYSKVALYDSTPITTTGQITLSDDITNYDDLEFIFGTNDSSNYFFNTQKISTDFLIDNCPYTSNPSASTLHFLLTPYNSYWGRIIMGDSNDKLYLFNGNSIKIYKIYGIKN